MLNAFNAVAKFFLTDIRCSSAIFLSSKANTNFFSLFGCTAEQDDGNYSREWWANLVVPIAALSKRSDHVYWSCWMILKVVGRIFLDLFPDGLTRILTWCMLVMACLHLLKILYFAKKKIQITILFKILQLSHNAGITIKWQPSYSIYLCNLSI